MFLDGSCSFTNAVIAAIMITEAGSTKQRDELMIKFQSQSLNNIIDYIVVLLLTDTPKSRQPPYATN